MKAITRKTSIFLAAMLGLALSACGGGGGSDNSTSPPAPTPTPPAPVPPTVEVVIAGKITFDLVPFNPLTNGLAYEDTVAAPVRGALVEAVAGGQVLASTATDDNGDYSLLVPADTSLFVRVRARMQNTGAPAWDITVIDNTSGGAAYVLDGSQSSSGSADSTRNLHAASGWDGASYSGARSAAPFAILDAMHVAIGAVLAVEPAAVFPAFNVNWSERNTPASGDAAQGQVSTTFYQFITSNNENSPPYPIGPNIVVLGAANNDTDEYDRHILIHEFGHYYEDQLSRSDSIGGEHGGGDILDARVAFSEGFGYAYAGIATGDAVSRDSSGLGQRNGFEIDVERNNGSNPGWYSEASVQSILYDLFDAADDGADALTMGFAPLHAVLTGAQRETELMTTLFSFISLLKQEQGGSAAGIDAIVAAQDVVAVGIDEAGSGETNNAGSADVLPLYTDIQSGGPAMNVCSISTFGTFNKLSVYRFLRFDVPADGNYRITADGPSDADPDIWVYEQGTPVAVGESELPRREELDAFLSAGTHVIEVYEYTNLTAMPRDPARTCFDMRITAL